MNMVAYLRVSTDDKGQDPERQRDVIERWAASNGHRVVRVVSDEGTRRTTSVMDRPMFKRAIRDAKEYAAEGIVAEQVERITGEGIGAEALVHVKLEGEHGLKLLYANLPPNLPPWLDELQRAIFASVGRAWYEEHCRKVRSGIRRSMAAGWPNGRPGKAPKPDLSPDEWRVLDEMVAQGRGNRLIAIKISEMREAHKVADPGARRRRMVSENWIRKHRARREAPLNQTSRPVALGKGAERRIGPESSDSGVGQ